VTPAPAARQKAQPAKHVKTQFDLNKDLAMGGTAPADQTFAIVPAPAHRRAGAGDRAGRNAETAPRSLPSPTPSFNQPSL